MALNFQNASVFSIEPNTTLQFPLNHGRILYNNIIANGSVTSVGGTDAANVLLPNTANRWMFDNDGQITITLPVEQQIDTICLGAHTLKGYSVRVEYSNSTSVSFFEFAPAKLLTSNTALMFHRPASVAANSIRITCTGFGGGNCVGVVYAGISLQMQRPYYSGSTPSPLNAKTGFRNSRTETGNFVGREIKRLDFATSPSWNNIEDSWYREFFQPFVECARALPFFYAWNLLEHPTDVGYFYTEDDFAPSYQGTLNYVQFSGEFLGVG
jgi:hypothetical protein